MGGLYFLLPLTVILRKVAKPISSYLLVVYLMTFVVGIIVVRYIVVNRIRDEKK